MAAKLFFIDLFNLFYMVEWHILKKDYLKLQLYLQYINENGNPYCFNRQRKLS